MMNICMYFFPYFIRLNVFDKLAAKLLRNLKEDNFPEGQFGLRHQNQRQAPPTDIACVCSL